MAVSPQQLLIPFKGGLDTYSNSHLLGPGYMTQALGVMLDRPGTAYPGPGYSVTQWAPTGGGAWANHGVGALSHGTGANADQVALWATEAAGSGPGVSVPGSASTAPSQQPLAPWRQSTSRFANDIRSNFGSGVYGSMTTPPQVAVSGGFAFYVWATTNGSTYAVAMAYQNLTTRAWAGPFYLDSNGNWSATAQTPGWNATPHLAVAGDGVYWRLGATNVAGAGLLQLYSYAISDPLTKVGSRNGGIVVMDTIDVASTGDEGGGTGYGIFITSTSAPQLWGYSFSSASSTFNAHVVYIATSVAAVPISISPIRSAGASTGFQIVTIDASNYIALIDTDLAGTVTGSVQITAFGTFTGATAAKQLTVANLNAGLTGLRAIAIEIYPGAQTVLSQSFAWNRVFIGRVDTSAPSVLVASTTLHGWGGLALLGKFYGWYNGVEYRPMFAVRSGWWQKDGTWGSVTSAGAGTPAYPNGYLYDYTGQLYAKFGDADVGTDSMWPTFSAAGYSAAGLPTLSDGFRYTLTSGQQTLTFPWPQYGTFDMVSARAASDSGSVIGAHASLSTVTWSAPTASEPPAQMVQFGGSLVIPGTITAYYDGSNVFEAGFFHRSPQPIVKSKGSGGSLPASTNYFFQTVVYYQDMAGRIHRGAPSLLVYASTTAGSDSFDIRIPGITQTLRSSTAVPIGVQVYRSLAVTSATAIGFTMYQVPGIFALNTANTDFLPALNDGGLSDANLSQCPTIYTAGMAANASVGTFAPPPFDSLTIWNSQLWGVANRNGPELWCSWPQDSAVLSPEGPAWSPANRIALPTEIGQPKALKDLDDKLIILGSRTDYGIVGNALPRSVSVADGNGTYFSTPTALPSPGGIKVLNGATRLPGGILLQGTQGFILLDRSLAYSSAGTQIKEFARNNLYLPGVLFPEAQAVLLWCANDATKNLIYFYESGEWSQAEQPPADLANSGAAAVMVGAARAVAGQGSQVYGLSSTGQYYVQLQPFSKYMSYRTAWVEMENHTYGKATHSAAGYGILREAQVLGQLPGGFPGAQTLTLMIEYDYENNTMLPPDTQIYSLTTGSQADLEYQWRFGFSQGNAKRVRFTVTVDGGARVSQGSTNPTVLLTGIMLSYDVDTGVSRLGPGNSTGT